MRDIKRWAGGIAATCLALAAAPATAQTVIDWTNGSGGSYNSGFNWAGFNIPNDVSESARFDGVNPGSPYDVFLFFNRTVSDLLVSGGDDVTFTRPSGAGSDATYTIDDDVIVTGATLSLADTFASTDVNLDIGDELSVNGGGAFNATDGSMVDTADLFVGRTSSGDGTVTVDDAMLDVSAGSILGSSGSTGTVTFQNGAAGDIGGTTTLVSGSTAGNTGRLNVLSGSTLSTENFRVGSLSTSASAVQEATLTVDGAGSTLTQTGASTLAVGDADNPNVVSDVIVSGGGTLNTGTGLTLIQNSGHVNVQSGGAFNSNGQVDIDGGRVTLGKGGAFTTGTSTATIDATGALNINGGPNPGDTSGVFTANGPMIVHGQVNIPLQDNVATDPGGVLMINDDLVIDGGTVHLGKGVLDADRITQQNGGQLVFTGGTLHFDQLSRDLRNEGGTFSPGRPSVNNGVGQTDIIGEADYDQQEGVLDIEIGGPVSGIDSDFVLIANDALLGGELQVTLINGYVPTPDAIYAVINAERILRNFDNVLSGGRIETTGGEGSFLMTISQGANRGQVALTAFELAGLPGDYNNNGVVDAADYTLWRDNLGAPAGTLPNDPHGVAIGAAQYATWTANFGHSLSGQETLAEVGVPVPNSLMPMLLGGILMAIRRTCRPDRTVNTPATIPAARRGHGEHESRAWPLRDCPKSLPLPRGEGL